MLRPHDAVFVALLCYGCNPTPPPVPPPTPDASDAAPSPPVPAADAAPAPAQDGGSGCSAACAALARIGCPEADAGDCAAVLLLVDEGRLVRSPSTGLPLTCACLAGATTGAAARTCGVTCSGVP